MHKPMTSKNSDKEFLETLSSNVDIKLLYAHRLRKPTPSETSFHHHNFWQLELILQGPVEIKSKMIHKELNKGEVVIIPPNVRHNFLYPEGDNEFITIRFKCSPSPKLERMQILRPNSLLSHLNLALTQLVQAQGSLMPHERILSEKLLTVYLCLMQIPKEYIFGNPNENLIQSVKQLIARQGGRSITIDELAQKMGYSTSYISSFFKKQEGISLKNYIDRERFLVAKQMLLYSDFDISRIAEFLDFPELNSFSRFIRKHSGNSPRKFRKGYY